MNMHEIELTRNITERTSIVVDLDAAGMPLIPWDADQKQIQYLIQKAVEQPEWITIYTDNIVITDVKEFKEQNHVQGDLLKLAENDFDLIVHGCNCFHTMGAGIAAQIAAKYPEALIADKRTVYGARDKLGDISVAFVNRADNIPLIIVNGYTQYGTAITEDQCVVQYSAVRNVFSKVHDLVWDMYGADTRIGYPAIGAGLAGGNWNIIKGIIDEELAGLRHTFVEYKG